MATTNTAKDPAVNPDRLRDEWLARFGMLIDSVETWARDLDWSTRRIEKKMDDHEIGKHPAPALLLQKEVNRALLDPIARSAPGAAEIGVRGNRCQFSFPTAEEIGVREIGVSSVFQPKNELTPIIRAGWVESSRPTNIGRSLPWWASFHSTHPTLRKLRAAADETTERQLYRNGDRRAAGLTRSR